MGGDADLLFYKKVAKDYKWKIDIDRWHENWPFQIIVQDAKDLGFGLFGNLGFIYALPIPPEALEITPIIASEITPTFGGVVEETSENVLWNISLRGTTGIAVNRDRYALAANNFRDVAGSTGLLSGLLNQVADAVTQAADIAADIAQGDFADAYNQLLGNNNWFKRSGVDLSNNGYHEMLILRKFLHCYSILKADEPDRWSLYFLHLKSNQKWQVVLKGFRIMQSKEDPFLLRYDLQFKGWGGESPDDFSLGDYAYDRFGSGGDLRIANVMTLTGSITKIANLMKIIKQGPAAILDSLIQVKPVL